MHMAFLQTRYETMDYMKMKKNNLRITLHKNSINNNAKDHILLL